MDFEDHFTSQIYANLYWPTLERFMEEQLPSPECYQPADIVQTESELDPPVEEDMLEKDGATLLGIDKEGEVATEHGGEFFEQEEFPGSPDRMHDIRLKMDKTGRIVATANQGTDYQHRGNDLTDVNVWDFVSRVEKIKRTHRKPHREQQKGPAHNDPGNDADDNEPEAKAGWNKAEDGDILQWSGRARSKVQLNIDHLEHSTHVPRVLAPVHRKVPVQIGPALPRCDREEVKHKHARLVLTLFKPWRHVRDLVADGETWFDAYEAFLRTCSDEIWRLISNMQILHECKDIRDSHYAHHHSQKKRDGVPSEFLCAGDANMFG
jgi:hypothetical protein